MRLVSGALVSYITPHKLITLFQNLEFGIFLRKERPAGAGSEGVPGAVGGAVSWHSFHNHLSHSHTLTHTYSTVHNSISHLTKCDQNDCKYCSHSPPNHGNSQQ